MLQKRLILLLLLLIMLPTLIIGGMAFHFAPGQYSRGAHENRRPHRR